MKTLLLLNAITTEIDYTGIPVNVGESIGTNYTIAIYLQNFTGILYTETSLAMNPTDDDWFPLDLANDKTYKLQYPQPSDPPTNEGGASGVRGYSFRINTLWLRSRVYRSYYLGTSLTLE